MGGWGWGGDVQHHSVIVIMVNSYQISYPNTYFLLLLPLHTFSSLPLDLFDLFKQQGDFPLSDRFIVSCPEKQDEISKTSEQYTHRSNDEIKFSKLLNKVMVVHFVV